MVVETFRLSGNYICLVLMSLVPRALYFTFIGVLFVNVDISIEIVFLMNRVVSRFAVVIKISLN